jgi:hypothetical protein
MVPDSSAGMASVLVTYTAMVKGCQSFSQYIQVQQDVTDAELRSHAYDNLNNLWETDYEFAQGQGKLCAPADYEVSFGPFLGQQE